MSSQLRGSLQLVGVFDVDRPVVVGGAKVLELAGVRDQLLDGPHFAFAGLRIPDLELDVVAVADNPAVLPVVTSEAVEDDRRVVPSEDVAGDLVGARVAGPASVPSRREITNAEVVCISS